MTWDKIIITTKGMRMEIDDTGLKFALLEHTYDSDGDRESEPYSIAQLVDNAEKYREKKDLEIQELYEKYRKELKTQKDMLNKVTEENQLLTERLKKLVLKGDN